MTDFSDEYYMQLALDVAQEGVGKTDFAPSIGCVIVKDGKIIGKGRTQDGGVPHAEASTLKDIDAQGATAYVTLEPCATPDPGAECECADIVINAGIVRVVMAVIDPDPKTNGQGCRRLKEAGIETRVGVLQDEAIAQNLWFYQSRGMKV